MNRITINGSPTVPVLSDFLPLSSLWNGDEAPYPTEFSARWALRKMRNDLAAAGAVAMHRNRLMIHPQRFAAVAERAALEQFNQKVYA